ncbi:hypothetical protein C5N14_01390 [Micromonospora sp. MW-13]|nr:hypothetical protein C5N14_01390 [Micromonospora sp. MW-13]
MRVSVGAAGDGAGLSWVLRTLPIAEYGSASTNSTAVGHLNRARLRAQWASGSSRSPDDPAPAPRTPGQSSRSAGAAHPVPPTRPPPQARRARRAAGRRPTRRVTGSAGAAGRRRPGPARPRSPRRPVGTRSGWCPRRCNAGRSPWSAAGPAEPVDEVRRGAVGRVPHGGRVWHSGGSPGHARGRARSPAGTAPPAPAGAVGGAVRRAAGRAHIRRLTWGSNADQLPGRKSTTRDGQPVRHRCDGSGNTSALCNGLATRG